MEEQIIIKSKKYSFRKIALIWLVITAVIMLILHLSVYVTYYNSQYEEYLSRWNPSRAKEYALSDCQFLLWYTLFVPIVASLVFFGVFFWLMYFINIVVTDKRVYGKTYFGRSVDLPMDSISSVGSAWFKGISVATSSGKISFTLIKNARKIHEEIRKLLIVRQEKGKQEQLRSTIAPQSNADELKKYKELFDSGIITQEEFEAKKKQLLGL